MSGVEDTRKHEVDPRTLQALERTLLAWLRTGLALIGFGFVIARLGAFLRMHAPGENVLLGAGVMGALFGILGIAAEVLAIARYSALRRALLRGRAFPVAHGVVMAFALSVAVLGGVLGVLVVMHARG